MEPTTDMDENSSKYIGDELDSRGSRGYLSDYEKEPLENP